MHRLVICSRNQRRSWQTRGGAGPASVLRRRAEHWQIRQLGQGLGQCWVTAVSELSISIALDMFVNFTSDQNEYSGAGGHYHSPNPHEYPLVHNCYSFALPSRANTLFRSSWLSLPAGNRRRITRLSPVRDCAINSAARQCSARQPHYVSSR